MSSLLKKARKTEVKDKKWLRDRYEQMETIKVTTKNSRGKRSTSYLKKKTVINLLNQLDEPEVLSQEWIDEHSYNVHLLGTPDVETVAVPRDDLEGMLVPKQELPVIPQFVAEWFESEGKYSSWWNWFYKWGRDESRTDLESKTIRWMQDFNEELFVDMFRYGYEVEKLQTYYVVRLEHEFYLETVSFGENGITSTLRTTYARDKAIKFNKQELAQSMVDLIGQGEVEELEE